MAFELLKDVKAFATAGVLAACLVSISSEAAEVSACPTFDAQAAVSEVGVKASLPALVPGFDAAKGSLAQQRLAQIRQAEVAEPVFWRELRLKADAAWSACKTDECAQDLIKRESLVVQAYQHLHSLAEVARCEKKLESVENALVSRQFAIQAKAGSMTPAADGKAIGDFLYDAKLSEVQAHFEGI